MGSCITIELLLNSGLEPEVEKKTSDSIRLFLSHHFEKQFRNNAVLICCRCCCFYHFFFTLKEFVQLIVFPAINESDG